MTHRGAAVLMLPVYMILGGCSPHSTPESSSVMPEVHESTIPEFGGPYAAEYREAYRTLRSEDGRAIIADENITEAEYAEMVSAYGACLESFGIRFRGYNPDFSHDYDLPEGERHEDGENRLNECAARTGEREINYLYSSALKNPDHLDRGTLEVACFIREGLVSPDYTVNQWQKDNISREFPIIRSDKSAADLDRCRRDPLGIMPR